MNPVPVSPGAGKTVSAKRQEKDRQHPASGTAADPRMRRGNIPFVREKQSTSIQSGKAGKTRYQKRYHQHNDTTIRLPGEVAPDDFSGNGRQIR
jgi:hypothetical protein